MTKAPTLIVYGGAFDPPHAGHVACVELARRAFPEAKVKILPAYAPAGASGAHKAPTASFEDRLALCQVAFPEADVDALEKDMPAPNYTVATLSRLAAASPGERLGWLMGRDQWVSLAGWKEPMRIRQLASLLIVDRDSDPATGQVETQGSAATDQLHNPVAPGLQPVYFIGAAASPAASRALRAQLARGETPPAGWLPPAVAREIAARRLYL